MTREEEPDPETVRAFGDGLRAYIAQFSPGADGSRHWLMARDGEGALSGGCRFMIEFGWTFMSWLCVAESHRRLGEGSRLLTAVERETRKRDMQPVHFDAFGFQGSLLYLRHGYSEFGGIAGFPKGFVRVWFMKRF